MRGFFDLSKNESLIESFAGVTAKYLVISMTSDWLILRIDLKKSGLKMDMMPSCLKRGRRIT